MAQSSVRALALNYPQGGEIASHSHPWDQLVYASRGVVTVETEAGSWVVPPFRAVWVPSDRQHRLWAAGYLALRTLYFSSGAAPALPRECCVFSIPPLLRELILHLVSLPQLDLEKAAHQRLVGVFFDLTETLPQEPLSLPAPKDERAKRLAKLLREQPGDQRTLKDLANAVGASSRTLERLFVAETGLTFQAWRRQIRLQKALVLLADQTPVTEVSFAVGYDSPSAFISMFRRALGQTPGRYFSSPRSEADSTRKEKG
ncbi:MAG: helix-turn-helix transcriptional regulator [Deltaproteobacteria bacterium]|nr:helix-turn-helix transcriptional regulator [Deltaproteobacteria bacterium]